MILVFIFSKALVVILQLKDCYNTIYFKVMIVSLSPDNRTNSSYAPFTYQFLLCNWTDILVCKKFHINLVHSMVVLLSPRYVNIEIKNNRCSVGLSLRTDDWMCGCHRKSPSPLILQKLIEIIYERYKNSLLLLSDNVNIQSTIILTKIGND